jgi:hypothetical protein
MKRPARQEVVAGDSCESAGRCGGPYHRDEGSLGTASACARMRRVEGLRWSFGVVPPPQQRERMSLHRRTDTALATPADWKEAVRPPAIGGVIRAIQPPDLRETRLVIPA